MDDATVTISLGVYQRLQEESRLLAALIAAGVDNWSGYGDAMAAAYRDDEAMADLFLAAAATHAYVRATSPAGDRIYGDVSDGQECPDGSVKIIIVERLHRGGKQHTINSADGWSIECL